jgi:hypothetical protein
MAERLAVMYAEIYGVEIGGGLAEAYRVIRTIGFPAFAEVRD